MEGSPEKYCKLCGNKTAEAEIDPKLTGVVIKEILDVFSLQIDFSSVAICNACTEKLLAAFRFKSACLYTDDLIFPYTGGAKTSYVDLKEIYMEVNKDQNLKEVLDDQQICRLCFKLEKVQFKMISELNPDILAKFFPEVNFATTINPGICMKCHDALGVHSTFLRNCTDAEEKWNMDTVVVGGISLTNPSIKTEEVEIKPEPIENETLFEIFEDIKKEENDEGDTSLNFPNGLLNTAENKNMYDIDDLKQRSVQSTVTNYDSKKCIYKTASESHFTGIDLRHKRDSKIQVNKRDYSKKIQYNHKNRPKSTTTDLKLQRYQCNNCIFNTRHKYSFIKHQLIHKDPSEVQMFECDECDYKSIQKYCLQQHQLRHKDPSEVQMFKCNVCDYKSRRKGDLRNHQLRHKDPSEMRMFKCDQCDYKSIRKCSLRLHLLRHKDASEVRMFECDECDYKSIQKRLLQQHQLRHKDPSEVQMFKCDVCDYKSIRKGDLRTHQLRHKDPSEVGMLKCDECDYKSIMKKDLRQHQLTHKDTSKVQIFNCNECDNKSIRKRSLRLHLLRQKILQKCKCSSVISATINKSENTNLSSIS